MHGSLQAFLASLKFLSFSKSEQDSIAVRDLPPIQDPLSSSFLKILSVGYLLPSLVFAPGELATIIMNAFGAIPELYLAHYRNVIEE